MTDFDLDRVGEWVELEPMEITASDIVEYATASGDHNAAHLAGELAPPLFGAVAVMPAIEQAQTALTPLYAQHRGLHGEHDLRLHEAMRPGMVVHPRAAVVGLHPRSSGTAVILKAVTETDGGVLLNEQLFTVFFKGVDSPHGVGLDTALREIPDGVRAGSDPTRIDYTTGADQAARYARASRDFGEYTLSDEAARAIGLPGVILHGLCTMAIAGNGLVDSFCGGDSTRLARLAVRFVHTVRPGDALATDVWESPDDGEGERLIYAFETSNQDGQLVLQRGRAEVWR